jgi:diguanylate cyclase (GGDEF)-like protein/PAS domain S-box-containing protein
MLSSTQTDDAGMAAPSPWRLFRNEWLLLAGALLLICGLTAYNLYEKHQTLEKRERERLAGQAQVIHDSLTRQFDSVNRALLNVRDEWPASRLQDGSVASAVPRLKAFVDAMPGVRGMFILDATGTLRAANFTQLIGLNFSDRVYFQAVAKQPRVDTLYLSPPFRTSLDVWAVNLVRMIPGPRGEFAGLVAATLDPEEFKLILRSVNYAPDVWSALAHANGQLFLMEPGRPEKLGADLAQPGSLFTRHMEQGKPASVMSGRVYLTGESRILAQHTIQPAELRLDQPMVVAIGRERQVLFAPWRAEALARGGLLGLLIFSTASGLFLLQRRKLKAQRQVRQAQEALREKTAELQHYFDFALNLLCIADFDGRFVKLNPAWESVLGYPPRELEGKAFLGFVHPDDRGRTLAALEQLRHGHKVVGLSNRYRHRAGTYRDIEWQAVPHGGLIFAEARDVTQERLDQQSLIALNAQLESQSQTLRSLAFLDGLTGVANRRRFDESLQTEWRQGLRNPTALGLLLLDVDYFKLYNDHYGHQAGDACLQLVANALRQHIGRPHDLLARYGGEEFVCLLPGTDREGVQAKAEELRQAVMALGLPHERSPVARVVTVSIGFASWIPTDHATPEQLLLAADAALYEAKNAGRNRVRGAPTSLAPASDHVPPGG